MQKRRFRFCHWCAAIALGTVAGMAIADTATAAAPIPLPRPRPSVQSPQTTGTARAPAPDFACPERLALVSVIQKQPPIAGPGACEADNVVRLISISSTAGGHIGISPPALLRCEMAEVFVHWVRQASEVAQREFGGIITGISTATSFDCRGQNRDPNAKLSQHGLANAVDVQALRFRDGKVVTLTDPTVSLHQRAGLHDSACKLFTTVLGPGSDGYHEDHIHLDLAERRGGYRICQWDLRDAPK
jgi:hypothetical protein